MHFFSILTVSVLFGLSAMALTLAACSIPKQSLLSKENRDIDGDWLYSNLLAKLYTAVFGNRDPVPICKSLGLKYDTFMVNCAVIRYTPDLRREAMLRILGVFMFVLGIMVSVVLISLFPMLIGIAAYLVCASYLSGKVKREADLRKATLVIEMSRFADLLLSALEVGMPVEIAIQQTADNVPCILSNELKESFIEVNMGARNWQHALEHIAQVYEVDLLSDFVLDITTAYNKGVSITDAVARKAYEIKQSALLLAKERTAKMSNIILVPVTVFKILPLMVIMMIPIIAQILTMFRF